MLKTSMDLQVTRTNIFRRYAKPLVVLGALSLGAAASEIFSRTAVNARIDGMVTDQDDTGLPIPFFCSVENAGAINRHFTGDELRLMGGLYTQAMADHLLGRAEAIEAAALASFRTDVRVEVILTNMQLESSLGVNRVADTSSARGNLQALDNTWMELLYNRIREQGDRYYYEGRLKANLDLVKADLQKDGSYKYTAPANVEKYLLDLRLNDPQLEAYVFAKEWARKFPEAKRADDQSLLMTTRVMGEGLSNLIKNQFNPDFNASAYLYRVHFLGEAGDKRLHNMFPWDYWWFADASTLFPGQAEANKDIFYEKNGRHRKPAEVHDFLSGKVGIAQDIVEELSNGGLSLKDACARALQRILPRPRPKTI